jgi:hypothetical protein
MTMEAIPSISGNAEPIAECDTRRGDDQSEHRGGILEQHREDGWILTATDDSGISKVAFPFLEFLERKPPRDHLEKTGEAKNNIVGVRVGDWMWCDDFGDAFHEGEGGTRREDEDRHEE